MKRMKRESKKWKMKSLQMKKSYISIWSAMNQYPSDQLETGTADEKELLLDKMRSTKHLATPSMSTVDLLLRQESVAKLAETTVKIIKLYNYDVIKRRNIFDR